MSEASESETSARWAMLLAPTYLFRLILLCVAVLLPAADSMMVATMAPDIVADIGGVEFIPWIIALYQLGAILASAVSARFSMRYGLTLPKMASILIFSAGCLMSGLAPNIFLMLIGRVLQGLGGGALIAFVFIASIRMFPSALIPRVMGAISVVWGAAAFLGPLVGGIFVETLSWRFGFYLFSGLAFSMFFLIPKLVPHGDQSDRSQDNAISGRLIGRLTILAIGLLALMLPGIDHVGWRQITYLVLGASLLGLFVRLDSRAGRGRMLPREAMHWRSRLTGGVIALLLFTAASVSLNTYGPLLMRQLHGASALDAGYVIATMAIGWSVAAFAISGVPERRGRTAIAAGAGLILLGQLGILYAMERGPLGLIGTFAALNGMGFGVAWTFVLARARSLVSESEVDRAAGLFPTIQRIGYTVGAAWSGIIAGMVGVKTGVTDSAVFEAAAFWIYAAGIPFILVAILGISRFLQPAAAGVFHSEMPAK